MARLFADIDHPHEERGVQLGLLLRGSQNFQKVLRTTGRLSESLIGKVETGGHVGRFCASVSVGAGKLVGVPLALQMLETLDEGVVIDSECFGDVE